MGKAVKIVAGIALAVGIAVAAPWAAAAILGSAYVAGTAAAIAITTAVAASLAVGAGLLFAAMSPKPSTGAATPTNVKQALNDSTIIIGKCRVGAKLSFFHSRKLGSDHYRYFAWAVAGHRVKGATAFYLNDEVVTVNPSTGAVTSGKYAGAVWMWFARGEHDATANPVFIAECDGKWTADHRGRGVAVLYVKAKMTKEAVAAGMPSFTVEVEGSDEIVDPRTGVTGYSNNASLAFYWWLTLSREEGGFGAADDEIDWDWVSAQANVCDEDVPLKAGGSEKRYALDGFMTTGADPSSIRDVLVANMAGRFTYSGGKMLARPGYWVPPTATLAERDLIEGGIGYDKFAPRDQLVTEVVATWNDPAQNYQPVELPALSVPSADVAQAGLDLPFVKSRARAQRIQKIRLLQAAADKTVDWPMNIMGLGIAPMDTVQLGTARYGLGNYAWSVTSWTMGDQFSVVLKLREEDPEAYEWSASEEFDQAAVVKISQGEEVPDAAAAALAEQVAQQAAEVRILKIQNSSTVPVSVLTSADAGGGSASITIAPHVRRYGDADVSVAGGVYSGVPNGTGYWVFYDDPGMAGGAVTYGAVSAALAQSAFPSVDFPSRHYVGQITTAAAGGGATGGGGGGPPGSGGTDIP